MSQGHEDAAPGAPDPQDDAAVGAEQAPAGADAPAGGASDEVDDLRRQVADRTADLQRLQAEYLNYKRRVDRDRESVKAGAAAQVLAGLLPVLDDIGRADEHGQLTGGFKAVADSLRAAVAGHGLEAFGQDGDAFDPQVHEALMHGYSADVQVPTADKVLQVGYRVGERVLRPARVSVVEPGDDPDAGPAEPADQPAAEEASDVVDAEVVDEPTGSATDRD